MGAEVNTLTVMAGADRADLKEFIKPMLAQFLVDNTQPRTSNMRDVEQIEAQMKQCKSAADVAQNEVQRLKEAVEKAERDQRNYQLATARANEERVRLEAEREQLIAKAFALEQTKCQSEKENKKLLEEKALAEKKHREQKQAAEKRRAAANEYMAYGLGYITGAKGNAERAADESEMHASLAADEYEQKS